jgi:predicted transposase YdaD
LEKKRSQEKDNIILNFAKMLKNSGLSMEEIHQKTGLHIEVIEKL